MRNCACQLCTFISEASELNSDLRVFFMGSPSARSLGKPLIGSPDDACCVVQLTFKCRSIDTSAPSEVTGITIESRKNSPLSVISRMICDVTYMH
jgi:hypothetical protein